MLATRLQCAEVMSFKRILCPTDFSPGSEHAVNYATSLAKRHGSELIFLHSWFLPASAYSLEYPFPPEVSEQIISDAKQRLGVVIDNARKAGVDRVSGEVVSGVPWIEITQMVDSRGVDLCVIGTHGRTGIKRVLLGSVAEKVVRHARCSVITIPWESEPTTGKHVLVATDFSETADYATMLATSLVDPNGTLHLVHCIELPVMYGAPLAIPTDYESSSIKLLTSEAAKLGRTSTARIETSHRVGSPGAEILRVIEENPAIDLVVTGSHGRTGIKRALLGSVAEKLVRHAARPVLIARKPDAA
jgi:nucleotide-binding universal stress UspA family protein